MKKIKRADFHNQVLAGVLRDIGEDKNEAGLYTKADIATWPDADYEEVFRWAMQIWLDSLDAKWAARLKNRPDVLGEI